MQERNYVRVPILRAAETTVFAQIETVSGSSSDARLVNVSAHGMLIRSQNPIGFGEIVDCTITDQSKLRNLKCKAEARWSAHSPGDDFAYRIGLSLRDFTDGSQEVWDEFRLSCLEEIEAISLIDPAIAIVPAARTALINLEGMRFRNIVEFSDVSGARLVWTAVRNGILQSESQDETPQIPSVKSDLKLFELRKILSESTDGIVMISKEGRPVGATSLRYCSALFQEQYDLAQIRTQKLLDLERAVIAHELRSPLAIIKTTAELLLSPEANFEEIRESGLLEGIRNKCDQGLQIADRYLSDSKEGNSRVGQSRIAVNSLMRNVIAEFAGDCASKSIEIVFDSLSEEYQAYAVELELIQAFRNIISNSIKYSKNGSKVFVTISSNNGQISIQVKDRGIGIPASQIDRLFSAFGICGNQTTGGEAQSGLGLFVTKQLIEKNQGKIVIQSKAGEGTTVTMTLPHFGT
jgi:signal transduction histidine kinase